MGAGVPAQRIGEKVWLFGAQVSQAHGTCAEFCVVPAWKAIRLPDGVSLEHGACLGVPAVTAVEALNAGGSVANKRVLVAGGAGRVGAYAVQFARACGAHVTATASARDCASVEQMGASRCFDYTDPELVRNLRDDSGKRGYDLIIEPRFGTNIALDARVLSRGGVIAAYGFDDNPSPVMPALPLVMNNAVCRFIGIFALHRAAQEAALEQVCRLTEQPGIEHRVGLQVALTEAAQAHQRIETGQVAGAALICI
ncbi:MAG: zinc-binding dehydrogenase [Burkholderiales bacterium]|nr:zinc-binding dehydrogenase [Burkholderiales bacterium]